MMMIKLERELDQFKMKNDIDNNESATRNITVAAHLEHYHDQRQNHTQIQLYRFTVFVVGKALCTMT